MKARRGDSESLGRIQDLGDGELRWSFDHTCQDCRELQAELTGLLQSARERYHLLCEPRFQPLIITADGVGGSPIEAA